jgi:A/G-specific adenine glycosylase
MQKEDFQEKLLSWYDANKRPLPWRDVNDPYLIWLSEIMLQQTQADTVKPYFKRFAEEFPTIFDLAKASRQKVLLLWEGLGYYSRARNMHDTAQKVVKDFDGQIPDTWDDIIQLKGIGPYTAAAVLSMAYQRPHAVMDGNVIRALSRWFGIEDDIKSSATKKEIQNLANDLLAMRRPGDFNQALMELGALVCTPSKPACEQCPLAAGCTALKKVKTDVIPYKAPSQKIPHQNIGVGIVTNKNDEVLIALRPEDGMLGGLWEFPGGKQKKGESIQETIIRELKEELDIKVEIFQSFMKLNHTYSHLKITLHASICRLVEGTPKPKTSQEFRWVAIPKLTDFPFPKANRRLTEKLMNTAAGSWR